MICPNCGYEIMNKDAICPYCSYKINGNNEPEHKYIIRKKVLGIETEGIELSNILSFVTGNPENLEFDDHNYYLTKWNTALFANDQCKSFNFPAAYFGSNWALYRKCYATALFIFLFELISMIAFGVIFSILLPAYRMRGDFLVLIVSIAPVRIFFGFIANKIYLRRTLKMTSKIKRETNDSSKLNKSISHKGGTNTLAIFIWIFIRIVIVLLFKFVI